MEFRSFSSIESFFGPVSIYEKIDGSNAQIMIFDQDGETKVIAGSRNRIITVDSDNFGFAKWVKENEKDLVSIFGFGRFYGEWFGPSIQRGYGLKEKKFAVFNHSEVDGKELLPSMTKAPLLYEGLYKEYLVQEVTNSLKEKGSVVAPGFMNPEGIVMRFQRNGALFKIVFKEPENKKEKQVRDPKYTQEQFDLALTYLQSDRLSNLLSKDERYIRDYPSSLPEMAKLYIEDLQKESFDQIDDVVFKIVKQKIYTWIKKEIESH